MIPDDIDRAVGSGARDIVNYSGLIMRTYISFREGKWQKIVLKYGEAMWLQVKVTNYCQYYISFRFMIYSYDYYIKYNVTICSEQI